MRRSAVLAVAGALAVAALVPASPAAASAKPTHVAIVIAGHGVACVRWHAGITGDEVLNDVATVRYRPTDGLITQIDGQPKNNRADETHYWSYWHNTGAGWRYSTSGSGAYLPKAGTVEGWHFINGSSTATPPPVRSYASICHDTAVVPPVVAPSSSSSSAARTTAAAPRPATAPGASTSPAARTSTGVSAGTTTATSARTAATTTPAARTSRPARATTSPSSAVAAAASALPTLNARDTAGAARDDDAGSALPTVLVVVLVLALGAVAAFVAQRRRARP